MTRSHTLICFFADHGDHLGGHSAWKKESFFEASCHISFLLSWPARLPAGVQREDLVCLTDLYGVDVLGALAGSAPPRETIVGMMASRAAPVQGHGPRPYLERHLPGERRTRAAL